jgi:glycosyltransferase involved in cell wall biosynthesis
VSAITAVILTFNEAIHIERCLARLAPLGARLVVVDSFSTDGTVEIARQMGAEVLQNPFVNHAAQFQWGVDEARMAEGWVLRIDADEYLEPALIDEIRDQLDSLPDEVAAVSFRRKVLFQGKWIRWGGYYPTVLTRLWRAGAAHIEQRWMDEHVVVERGETQLFRRGDLVDDNLHEIAHWTDKHNKYTTRQMIEFLSLDFPLIPDEQRSRGALNRDARLKRFLRNGVYARSPLYLRALLYYLQRYVLRLGFLDGRRGFVFHTLQGFWNFLLVDVKIGEARAFIAREGLPAFLEHLEKRHGIALGGGAAARSERQDEREKAHDHHH